MEDSELTRKAIEELMKEMDEFKGKEIMPTERKKNPMGRPNKLFLGRTINSMLTHNKRQNDRNLQRCERKLKELDEKQNKKKLIKHRRARRGKTENLNEVISIESCDDAYKNKTSKRLRKKKIRKKQRRSSSSSSTSSTQTESSTSGTLYSQSKRLNRKTKKHKKASKEESGQQFDNDYVNDNAVEYYVDPNMAYAVMAYSQINHMMQQQQMFQQQIVKKELEESVEIPSDLSISCHSSSESSINISVNSSSAEEDENGILTFKLSSDDGDEIVSRISQKDYDYYDRRFDDSRDLFERRYQGSRMRDFPPPPLSRRDPMPLPPPLSGSLRGGSLSRGYDSMFSRRSPPPSRGSNGMGRYGGYEDFSRDSFDDRMMSSRNMRCPSPPGRRYAPY